MAGIFRYALQNLRRSDSALKNFTVAGTIGAGIDGTTTYMTRREEHPDESKAVSGLMAAGTAAAWLFAEPLMWGITVGQMANAGMKMAIEEAYQNRDIRSEFNRRHKHIDLGNGERINQATFGGNFVDSAQAATLRQRQLQSLRQTRIQTENILGSEARQLHR
jgi:hypothetical protein